MISESLKINTTLTELYLGGNKIEVKWKQRIEVYKNKKIKRNINNMNE